MTAPESRETMADDHPVRTERAPESEVTGARSPSRHATEPLWPPTAADRRALLTAAGIATVARLVLLLTYSPQLAADSGDYLGLAHRIASGNFTGWQARRTPVYPLLLLLVHYSPSATWWIQGALGVLSTTIVFALIRVLGGPTRAALLGSVLYGASLEVLAVERLVLTETLTSFLLLVAALLCVLMIRSGVGLSGKRRTVCVVGVVVALLCLTRPDTAVAAAALTLATAAALGLRGRSLSRRARARLIALGTVAMLGPAALGVLAWAAFNDSTAGTFTASSVLGFNMIDHVGQFVTPTAGSDEIITAAYARQYKRGVGFPSYAALPEIERRTGLDSAQISSRYLQIALRLALAHPVSYVTSSIRQWVETWRQPNYADSFANGSLGSVTPAVWDVERTLQILVSAIFLAICALAAIASIRSRRGPLDLSCGIVAGTALVGTLMAAFVGYTDPGRYAYPFFPLVICVAFAAAGPALGMIRGASFRHGRERSS
jgi:hypothetical protein